MGERDAGATPLERKKKRVWELGKLKRRNRSRTKKGGLPLPQHERFERNHWGVMKELAKKQGAIMEGPRRLHTKLDSMDRSGP